MSGERRQRSNADERAVWSIRAPISAQTMALLVTRTGLPAAADSMDTSWLMIWVMFVNKRSTLATMSH